MPLKTLRRHTPEDRFYDVLSGAQKIGVIESWDEHPEPMMFKWQLLGHTANGFAKGFDRAKSELALAWEQWLDMAGLEPKPRNAAYPSSADVDTVLAEFDNDARAAISALLHDNDKLARDAEAKEHVSRGYTRGRFKRTLF